MCVCIGGIGGEGGRRGERRGRGWGGAERNDAIKE